MKTAALTGMMLDYWVAEAEGMLRMAGGTFEDKLGGYSPSTKWAHGGPLIEKYTITPYLSPLGGWAGYNRPELHMHETHAPTPLVAICRAVVQLKFGDEVNEVEA